jgi:hypothetical protein
MAQRDLSGFNGGVTLPTGIGGQASAFTFEVEMRTKEVHRYGGTRFGKFRGGILIGTGDISLFYRMGAAAVAANFVAPAADGATGTLTAEIGCTWSGIMLMTRSRIGHDFVDPAIGGTRSFSMSDTITEVWDTTT